MTVTAETVLIVGTGNELLGDEGLGIHVARSLVARCPLPARRRSDRGRYGSSRSRPRDGPPLPCHPDRRHTSGWGTRDSLSHRDRRRLGSPDGDCVASFFAPMGHSRDPPSSEDAWPDAPATHPAGGGARMHRAEFGIVAPADKGSRKNRRDSSAGSAPRHSRRQRRRELTIYTSPSCPIPIVASQRQASSPVHRLRQQGLVDV